MFKNILKSTLIASFGAILFSCGSSGDKQEVVNVYTHRHYEADQKLFDMFSEKPSSKCSFSFCG